MMHEGRLLRRNFGKIEKIIDLPHLIEMQRQSYERFLQKNVSPERREEIGLQGVFESVFPIKDFSGSSALEFVRYQFGDVKYEKDECLQRGMTYEAPLKITVRLVVFDMDKETGAQSIRDIKEQEIYFGTIPLMTENGNLYHQWNRTRCRQPVASISRNLFRSRSRQIPLHRQNYSTARASFPFEAPGSILEFDPKDILHVRIDRRRKFPVTTSF